MLPASDDNWLAAVPENLHPQLVRCLGLYGMVCAELLAASNEQVARLSTLTGLDAARMAALNALPGPADVLAVLRAEPRTLYNWLLLGRLALDTAVAAPVLRYVQQQANMQAEELQQLRAYCRELGAAVLALLEEHAPEQGLGLHRLRVEEAFAAYVAAQPALAPPVATLRFSRPQRHIMQLALLLVHSLSEAGQHPFLRAVAALPALRPAALEPLIARVGATGTDEELSLTLPELLQLYQAAQVCGMVFVSDVQEVLGLGHALQDAPPAAGAAAPEFSTRQAVGEIISGLTHMVQREFANHPALQLAKQEVLALANEL